MSAQITEEPKYKEPEDGCVGKIKNEVKILLKIDKVLQASEVAVLGEIAPPTDERS